MARVKLSRTGFTELRHHPGVVKYVESRASAVLDQARATAPRDTEAYVRSLQAKTERHPSRTVVHVGATVRHALQVEGRHGTLSRALDAAGGRR